MTQNIAQQPDKLSGRGKNYALWAIQGLLALVFLFAGGFKLLTPIEQMLQQMPIPLSGAMIRFIGTCEFLGAVGLILPGLLRMRPGLTPLAACGLVIIMIGATVYNVRVGTVGAAVFTVVLGILATFVAYGRWSSLRAS